jgi:hypothetical protein
LASSLPRKEVTNAAGIRTNQELECLSADILRIDYIDPVYGTETHKEILWRDIQVPVLTFLSKSDSRTIASLSDREAETFLAQLLAISITRDRIDTLLLTFTTDQGETETFKAIETGVYTGLYQVEIPFRFSLEKPVDANGKLDPRIEIDQTPPTVLATGTFKDASGVTAENELTLISQFIRAGRAWAKDENRDGRVDAIYIAFDEAPGVKPSQLDPVSWNRDESSLRRKVDGKDLEYLNGSSTLRADLSKNPFPFGLTGIPSGAQPFAKLPNDALFGGYTVILSDSVGPVPIAAEKIPSDLSSYSVGEFERRFDPDTLLIQVSEPIRTRQDWIGLFRFAKDCDTTSPSIPLPTLSDPEVSGDGLEYRILVDNSPTARTPLVGDCIYLETDGRFTDLPGNLPGLLGVPLSGKNPRLTIRNMQGYPPVSGLDPHSTGYVLATQDERTAGGGSWSQQSGGEWEVFWIPPSGFEAGKPYRSDIPSKVNEDPSNDRENRIPTTIPRDISIVRVVTSGRYIANVNIFDHLGIHVASFKQAFGYNGELRNPYRITDKGVLSFLVWNQKDKQGQVAGQGVYIWKVLFELENGNQELQITRTGLMRPNK